MAEVAVLERDQEQFYTARSLARRLAVDEKTVKNLLRSGEIASYRIGRARRIAPEDVASYLASRRDDRRAA